MTPEWSREVAYAVQAPCLRVADQGTRTEFLTACQATTGSAKLRGRPADLWARAADELGRLASGETTVPELLADLLPAIAEPGDAPVPQPHPLLHPHAAITASAEGENRDAAAGLMLLPLATPTAAIDPAVAYDPLWWRKGYTRYVSKKVDGLYSSTVDRAGAELGVDFDPDDPTIADALDGLDDTADLWGAGLGPFVEKQVRDGMTAGDTVDGLATRLRDSEDSWFGIARSVLLASVAVAATYNRATLAAGTSARAHGTSSTKEWAATIDERTRDTHIDMDGQSVDIGEDFLVAGAYPAAGPHDERLPVEETANCRCVLILSSDGGSVADESTDVQDDGAATLDYATDGSEEDALVAGAEQFHTHGHCERCGGWLEGRSYCGKCGRGYTGPLLDAGNATPSLEPADVDPLYDQGSSADTMPINEDVGLVATDGVDQEDAEPMTTTAPSTGVTHTSGVTVATNDTGQLADLVQRFQTAGAQLADGTIGMVPWRGVLAVEGRPTGDGRMFRQGSLRWDEAFLPTDLFAMLSDPDGGGGHDGSSICGRIDSMWKQPSGDGSYTEIWGEGVYDTGTSTGAEVFRLQQNGMLTGVSIDVDSVEVVMPEINSDEDFLDLLFGGGVEEYSSGRIRRATVCSIPAFIEARIFPVTDVGVLVASAASEGFKELRVWTPLQTAADQDIPTLVASLNDNGCDKIRGWRTGSALAAALERSPMPSVADLAGLLGAEIVEVAGTLPPHANAADLNDPRRHGVDSASSPARALGSALGAASAGATWTGDGTAMSVSHGTVNASSLVASAPSVTAQRLARPLDAANARRAGAPGAPTALTAGSSPAGSPSAALRATPSGAAPIGSAGNTNSSTGLGSSTATASRPSATGSFGKASGGDALSAERASMSYTGETSTLTTATPPAQSGASSAGNATRPSDFSVMTLKFSGERRVTSLKDEPFLNDLILNPPAWVFQKRAYSEYTPMTVDEHGVVSGMVTPWGTCHLGFTDQCVIAPRTSCGYANARTGHVLTAQGDLVATARIFSQFTPGRGGHAPGEYAAAKAVEWYESMCLAVADVAVYEDNFGIQVQGRVRPGVSAAQVIALRASDISPDWRSISGRLECVGFAAVNVSGFPNRQLPALVASAMEAGIEIPGLDADLRGSAFIVDGENGTREVRTLIASGGPTRDPALALVGVVQAMAERLEALEQAELARQRDALLAGLPSEADEQAELAARMSAILDGVDLDVEAAAVEAAAEDTSDVTAGLSAEELDTLRAALAITERLSARPTDDSDLASGDTMTCPNCGATGIPADATECPRCGESLDGAGGSDNAAEVLVAACSCSSEMACSTCSEHVSG